MVETTGGVGSTGVEPTVAPKPASMPGEQPLAPLPKFDFQGQDAIDQTIEHHQDVMIGEDSATQQMMARMQQESAAAQAAMRGAQRQRQAQAGISGITSNILADIADREMETVETERYGQMAQIVGQRADQAAGRLGQLGMQERQYESQVVNDLIANSDLTDPEQLSRAKEAYKELHGIEPSFSQIKREQWNSKLNEASRQFDAYLIENRVNYTDDKGDINYDKIMEDPAAMRMLEQKYNARMHDSDAFDPNDPLMKDWVKSQIDAGTTSELDLAVQEAQSLITQSDQYQTLLKEDPDAAQAWLDAIEIETKLGVDIGSLFEEQTGLVQVDEEVGELLGGRNIDIDGENDTVTAGDNIYKKTKSGWKLNGKLVKDENIVNELDKFDLTTDQDMLDELDKFDPFTATEGHVSDFIDKVGDSPSEIDSKKANDLLLNNPEAIPDGRMEGLGKLIDWDSLGKQNGTDYGVGAGDVKRDSGGLFHRDQHRFRVSKGDVVDIPKGTRGLDSSKSGKGYILNKRGRTSDDLKWDVVTVLVRYDDGTTDVVELDAKP